jgi:hypothetical protein
MAVTPYNVIQGPGRLFVAPYPVTGIDDYLTTDPATLPVGAPFVDVGGTTGGITVEVDETIGNITVDQILDPVGGRTTARTLQVTTTFMETDVANLRLAMNGATSTTETDGSGDTPAYIGFDLNTQTSATQPLYSTIIVDGWGATTAGGVATTRRFIMQKVLSAPKVSQKFNMADQATVAVTFTAYYVSSSISPFSLRESTTGSTSDNS